MKRWPILVSFVLFVGLCASATFWAMQWFKPVARLVAVPKQSGKTEADLDAALGLFGGRTTTVAAASNYQLKGVVVSKNAAESIAILVADSKPPEALRVNSEVTPGVTVKEVHSQYVLLSDRGTVKRVELPASAPQARVESPLGTTQQAPAISQQAPAISPVGASNLPPPPPSGAAQEVETPPASPNSPQPRAGRPGH